MTVYALMTGMYETISLAGVYATREAAEEAGRIHQGTEKKDWERYWEVEEHEVNEQHRAVTTSR